MPITTTVPNASKRISPYGVDLTTATIKCALFTTAQTGIGATATLYSGLTGEVTAGSGYSSGGNTVTGLAWTGTTTPQISGTISPWSSATFTFRYAVIYDVTTSKIISYTDFGADQVLINGTLTLSFDPTDGYIKVSSS